ncbi:hypothetical protein SFRURICE_007055 [Spodoptera frugiperda]|nr:hypothetical protein SFRURICE_007055 [Spodoptera frugiperda]
MSAKRRPPVLLKPNRASKIIALVPNENAPSDASEISDSETELHDARTNSSTPLSSPAPSIASSLANLTIDTSDDEELNSEDTDIIPDSIVREIGNSIYENVPSLSAIPSLPATPITPIASSLVPRKTRSRKPPTVKAKRPKKAKKFQLTYNWRVAQFRHQATIEEGEDDNYIDLPEDDSPLSFFHLFFSQDILTNIVEQTNLYSVQQTGKSIQLTDEEFRDFLAIHVLMGIVVMPSYLDYWSEKFRYGNVADIMSLKRYQLIRRYLHFVDNTMDDGDKYFKVVIALCQSISQKPSFVFCDNFFSSPELLFILRENYGVFALGTIRGNRLRGAEKVLPTEKAMRKKPRGHFVEACKKPLKVFRFDVYELLCKSNRSAKRKQTESVKIKKPQAPRPLSPLKYDNTGHFPSTMEEGRCRFCQKKTVVYCIKCNTRLCFVTGKAPRNCFLNFHTK